jgi:hypothetical protein
MADYLLHEGPMGYSVFKVVHQVDTVGNRLKEVQDSVQDLAKFGKMVQLVSFVPFEYAHIAPAMLRIMLIKTVRDGRLLKSCTTSLRA